MLTSTNEYQSIANYIGEMTFRAYLDFDSLSENSHEFIDGHVFSMAGGSGNHSRLAASFIRRLPNERELLPCHAHTSDRVIKVGNKGYHADVLVDCKPISNKDQYTTSPLLIVEILSPSTHRYDRHEKFENYKAIPEFEEYLLVHSNQIKVEIFLRKNNWERTVYNSGDALILSTFDTTYLIDDLYIGLKFEE